MAGRARMGRARLSWTEQVMESAVGEVRRQGLMQPVRGVEGNPNYRIVALAQDRAAWVKWVDNLRKATGWWSLRDTHKPKEAKQAGSVAPGRGVESVWAGGGVESLPWVVAPFRSPYRRRLPRLGR